MIPSKWFHKLKNMTKPREKHPPLSYSFNTINKKKSSTESKSLPHTSLESKVLKISPRSSLHMIQSKRKTVYKPSPSSTSSLSAGFNKKKIKFLPNQDSSSHSSNLKLSYSADNIIIEMNNRDFKKKMLKEIKVFDSTEKACTASNRTNETLKTHNHQKTIISSGRRSSVNSPAIKLRVNSHRIQVSVCRSRSRLQRKQVIESFAVIKNSVDPKKDFRESMVEMIQENKIRASKDLEDLLACYLLLNPKEYHVLIIKVFVQVWLEVIMINSTFASK